MFSDCDPESLKLVLREGEEIFTDDNDIATIFNSHFENAVNSLDITENRFLLNDTHQLIDPVDIALKKFEIHPSIIEIKKQVNAAERFSFSKVSNEDILVELGHLDIKKSGTFGNISAKILRENEEVVAEPLRNIWNTEIIESLKFPSNLKLAVITPVFKSLDCF